MAIDPKDISNLDISQLVSEILTPIDSLRNTSVAEGYLESRTNAFYRMIGFPVVSTDKTFYSPGFSIDANTDPTIRDKHAKIDEKLLANKDFCSRQLYAREKLFKDFESLFAVSGFNAIAVAKGSVFIRSFDKQFGGTKPFEFDASQVQSVGQRLRELSDYYNNDRESESFAALTSKKLLQSAHILKPFVVDPRITQHGLDNLVAAPFPRDASEIRKFDKSSYPRPYIERVISVRLAADNPTDKIPSIQAIIQEVKKDQTVIDAYLLSVSNNSQKELRSSEIAIFSTYLKLLRSIINRLIFAIQDILSYSKKSNFQPIPDKRNGLEGTITQEDITPGDIHALDLEKKILDLYLKITLEQLSHPTDPATGGDSGGYVFSSLDDQVFSAETAGQQSKQKELDRLKRIRSQAFSQAAEELKSIEYIMGEFSGLGLIDIVAIQSAFWLMDRDMLVGMIDSDAYDRLINYRSDLRVDTRNDDIEACLAHYEEKLKQVYSLIQLHFDQVLSGAAWRPSK